MKKNIATIEVAIADIAVTALFASGLGQLFGAGVSDGIPNLTGHYSEEETTQLADCENAVKKYFKDTFNHKCSS
ncbi:hypothetical protein DID80_01180 [Candidatus Marinamargulisbacteria bacterium SCGC AAA071-K20]|nr:hypothetical protein DID80_01180 [Candidatus Marinamargulisbacteria bacterium SCGC AAA071-K20]